VVDVNLRTIGLTQGIASEQEVSRAEWGDLAGCRVRGRPKRPGFQTHHPIMTSHEMSPRPRIGDSDSFAKYRGRRQGPREINPVQRDREDCAARMVC